MLSRDFFFFLVKYTAHQTLRDRSMRSGLVTWYSNFLQTQENFPVEKANILTFPSHISLSGRGDTMMRQVVFAG